MTEPEGPRVRPATMKVIAANAGVGLATVSRALTGSRHVSEATRERVEAAAKELGYRPSALGRGLKRQRTDTIGLIVGDIANQFYGDFADGVLSAAHAADRHVIVGSSGENSASESENIELLLRQRVDGIIAFPTGGNVDSWRDAASLGVKVVFADRTVEGLEVPTVVVDNEEGMRQLTRHLLDLGHRSIGFLGGPRHVSSGYLREMGYRRAMREAGIAVDESLVTSQGFTRESGHAGASLLLEVVPRPTAIIASNNVLAEAALMALRGKGIRIPEEMSFAMVDDVPWTALTHPSVTVLAQSAAELGRAAVRALLSETGTPDAVVLPTWLIERESTGPAPASPRNNDLEN